MVLEKQLPRSYVPSQDPAHAIGSFADATMVAPAPSQRYYAPAMTEEKRRGFWRKSIKPDEIGVAVSPEIVQQESPISVSSQRTTSQLLPDMQTTRLEQTLLRITPQTYQQRAFTDLEDNFYATNGLAPQSQSQQLLQSLPARQRPPKAQRFISSRKANVLPSDDRARMCALQEHRDKAAQSLMPLTPVYDNGQYKPNITSDALPGPNGRIPPLPPIYQQGSRVAKKAQFQAQRKRSSNHPGIRLLSTGPRGALNTVPRLYPPGSRIALAKQVTSMQRANTRASMISDGTLIEEDDEPTPENEEDKQLRQSHLPSLRTSEPHTLGANAEETSPIKDLRYPQIPRPSAISRQAAKIATPRASQFLIPDGPTPVREHLIRNECSFLQSSTTSSKDESATSFLAKRVGDTVAEHMLENGLKISSRAANRPGNTKWEVSKNEQPKAQLSPAAAKNRMEITKSQKGQLPVERTPTRTFTPAMRGGDLYLAVE